MYGKILAFLAAVAFSSSASAEEFIVKYKDSGKSKMLNITSTLDAKVLDTHDVGNLIKVDMKIADAAKLMTNPDIEYVVPNFKLHSFGEFSTEALKEQWALTKVKAAGAWEKAGNKGSHSAIVAVIDTGADYKHPALAPNMVPGYDFKDNDDDPMDETGAQNPGHGTHCSGIIGATGLIDGGTSGLSAEVSIMPIRFLGADGSGDLMAAIKAIDYAIEKKADVISASWGATIDRAQAQPLVDAVKRADDAGVIFVAAAANDGKNNDNVEVYPANAGFPNTITVAASGSADEKPSWSNYGTATVHLASPGLDIISTLPSNKYGSLSGTSMATPLVAGAVALLLAQDPDLTGAEVRALLQSSAAAVSIQTACNCRIDAEAAVTTLLAHGKWLVPTAGSLKAGEEIKLALKNSEGSVSYTSSDAAVATVDSEGTLTAVADGAVKVKAVDQSGTIVESLDFHVGAGSTPDPQPEECPLGDPSICELMCLFQPDLPWCK